jgi:hypothetical protein
MNVKIQSPNRNALTLEHLDLICFRVPEFGNIWVLSFDISIKVMILQILAWHAEYAFKNIILKTV